MSSKSDTRLLSANMDIKPSNRPKKLILPSADQVNAAQEEIKKKHQRYLKDFKEQQAITAKQNQAMRSRHLVVVSDSDRQPQSYAKYYQERKGPCPSFRELETALTFAVQPSTLNLIEAHVLLCPICLKECIKQIS